MKQFTFRTIIQKDGQGFHGFVPSLPGCHTQGDTVEETKKNLEEAIKGYLMSLKKHNEPIPKDEGFETITVINIDKKISGPSYA
ncbi:type II toxin-antitoxin system HicB family antitoxin [Patescibacteria group bacterium]|nr:type II toxin-antitoxin system HicB family antitoxin [Patescibacteria group bacterium]MBU4016139.1 type II toxin-antitoxin system HicB family antitoxin [Patescibacteria group bacterium]